MRHWMLPSKRCIQQPQNVNELYPEPGKSKRTKLLLSISCFLLRLHKAYTYASQACGRRGLSYFVGCPARPVPPQLLFRCHHAESTLCRRECRYVRFAHRRLRLTVAHYREYAMVYPNRCTSFRNVHVLHRQLFQFRYHRKQA